MSTFGGVLKEFPHISIDSFNGANLKSKLFFLSHCHMDHMDGLADFANLRHVLYTSQISSVIVRKKFPHINVVALDFGAPTLLNYTNPADEGETHSVLVTTLPAGHMPGSVMLYFQNSNTNVLYTGDFRLKKIDIERIKPLKLLADSRTCDAIYFDSTFFSSQYKEFPPQHESIEAIIKLIQPWLKKSTKHQIELKTPATYGSELLFKKISKATGMKIHVNDAVYEQYRYIPDMDNCIIKSPVNPLECRIHACYGSEKEACLKDYKNSKQLRIIRPSAMIWRYWTTGKEIVAKIPPATTNPSNKTETYRVCYSNHSSLSEIRDLLLYLKPKKVNLNVINSSTEQEMLALKQQIMNEYCKEKRNRTVEAVHQPFVAIQSSFSFATAQTLATRIYSEQIEINEEFVLPLPKRRKRIEVI